jgi:hypothetical protein
MGFANGAFSGNEARLSWCCGRAGFSRRSGEVTLFNRARPADQGWRGASLPTISDV